MIFNSYIFLIFFPVVVGVYYLVPAKYRNIWLLIASYYFYMSWNAKYALLILLTTSITYVGAILVEKGRTIKNRISPKILMWGGVILTNLGILFFFKYYSFFFQNITTLFSSVGIGIAFPAFDVILPVGISFYTFQALGYCIDVYRGDVKAEKSFLRYALFISFFPQLVAGPIERSGNLLHQLANPHKVSYKRIQSSVLLMLWGFFQKIVIADRIAVYVDSVYENYAMYPGMYIVIASILFAFQIYCDFGGYSNIAKGAAGILGIDLMDNFASPYLSQSCGEFWRRWHISLSSWFKDYLYIPLGGNRKGKLRKYLNLMIVFGLSGLWHGANWTYIVWGLLNGFFQVIGDLTMKMRSHISDKISIDREKYCAKIAKAVITFCFIDFAWVFFRAESIHDAVRIVKSMFTDINPWVLFDDSIYQCGLSEKGFSVLFIALVVLLCIDIANIKGKKVREIIMQQDYWFRVLLFAMSVCVIIVFGIWGTGYESDAFLYFQF